MNTKKTKLTLDQIATYQIKVPGHLDEGWLDEVTISVKKGEDGTFVSVGTGPEVDVGLRTDGVCEVTVAERLVAGVSTVAVRSEASFAPSALWDLHQSTPPPAIAASAQSKSRIPATEMPVIGTAHLGKVSLGFWRLSSEDRTSICLSFAARRNSSARCAAAASGRTLG